MRTGQIDMAIVGGANVTLRPVISLLFFKYNMLSKAGKCQFLDAQADGYARSEAISTILLQHRADARRIYANIVNIRTNCDGYKSQGITYPSKESQAFLMKTALHQSDIEPKDVHYIEAHGTGTQAGDLVEISAIHEAYGKERDSPLLVGSVKTNMGHSESASGLASIAKVLITFECCRIPPILHYSQPNPKISPLIDGSIVPVLEETPFDDSVVAVNSFGFGGSNVHILLKPQIDLIRDKNLSTNGSLRLIPLCGRTEESVEYIMDFIDNNQDKVTDDFLALLDELTCEQDLRGMNYHGYMVYQKRMGNEHDELESYRDVQEVNSETREVWFLISGTIIGTVLTSIYSTFKIFIKGMGTQWKGMASGLMHLNVFRESIERTAQYLEEFGIDLIDLITSDENIFIDSFDGSSIAISSVQIALLDLLNELGVKCDRMIGHSAGELICAYADGLLNARQVIEITYLRAQCLKETNLDTGLMAAVGLTWQEAIDRCPPKVYPACHNSQNSVTIAGYYSETKSFLEQLKQENVFTKEVKSCGLAFHSPLMYKAKELLLEKIEPIIPKQKRSDKWLSSSVPAERWTSPEAIYSCAHYYVNNLMNPVLFDQCIQAIPKNAIVIEIAPDSLFRNIVRKAVGPDISYVGLMKRNNESNNLQHLLSSIGQIHCLSLKPRIQKLYPKVEFPVSRGTQSIGSLVKWDHSEEWLVTLYPNYFHTKNTEKIESKTNSSTSINKIKNENDNGSAKDKSDENSYMTKINTILGIKNASKIRKKTKLHELGLDSLMNNEVNEVLLKEFKIEFSVNELSNISYGELINLKNKLADLP